ncbi:DgyrCDS511 [Dimorphilus gyrociliatus]|uniref:DgyrCDS511 n=1 Tax=Dimorphilus gyrociliatus TaxID=2664684 RepID=A0A7I8V4N1_9ANNE|nr:DgyrCDS511 [Dimorphilus gyrociliatus]
MIFNKGYSYCWSSICALFWLIVIRCSEIENSMDMLQPYFQRHGSHHSVRYIRSCQAVQFNETLEERLAPPMINKSLPLFTKKFFARSFENKYVKIHMYLINNPSLTLSVVEPGGEGGCKKGSPTLQTVRETAKTKKCRLAINAGFFNTTTNECYGDIVSNSKIVQSTAYRNAHFGIRKDNSLTIGYLSDKQLSEFKELVTGAIWIIRNGSKYIEESIKSECTDVQETNPQLTYFATVQSARSVVGFKDDGTVVIFQVDGKTGQEGMNLFEVADFLIPLGVKNAINLDGGGSSSLIEDNVLVNYPSDTCAKWNCERKVSTILCVRDIEEAKCPRNCSDRGICRNGECKCSSNWKSYDCSQLFCGKKNCSSNGLCTESGCLCYPGYKGSDCDISCPKGYFGLNCLARCRCSNHSTCDKSTGYCDCDAGYRGLSCDLPCPIGRFGKNCKKICSCLETCSICDRLNGSCTITSILPEIDSTSKCLINRKISKDHLVRDSSAEQKIYMICVIALSIAFTLSISLNITLYCLKKTSKLDRKKKRIYRSPRLVLSSSEADNEDGDSDLDLNDLLPLKNVKLNNENNESRFFL